MAQKFTLFLADGTPLRAEVSVKTGLPASLTPAALAARYSAYTLTDGVVRFGDGVSGARPPSGPRHAGGANFAMMDGSVRMFQPNQSDLVFLANLAGRVPLEQVTQTGPGVLFLNCQGTPITEIDNFLRRMELAIRSGGRAVERLKIGGNLTQARGAPAPSPAPGAHTVPSQMRTILLSPSPSNPGLRTRGAVPATTAATGIDRFTQGFEKTFTVRNVFPTHLSGGTPTASRGNSLLTEKITMTYEGIEGP